jgi:hypothetical protein
LRLRARGRFWKPVTLLLLLLLIGDVAVIRSLAEGACGRAVPCRAVRLRTSVRTARQASALSCTYSPPLTWLRTVAAPVRHWPYRFAWRARSAQTLAHGQHSCCPCWFVLPQSLAALQELCNQLQRCCMYGRGQETARPGSVWTTGLPARLSPLQCNAQPIAAFRELELHVGARRSGRGADGSAPWVGAGTRQVPSSVLANARGGCPPAGSACTQGQPYSNDEALQGSLCELEQPSAGRPGSNRSAAPGNC